MPLIRLYANLRKIAGKNEVSIAGGSVGEILSELVRQIPALEASLLNNGQIRPHVIITINGHPTTDAQAAVTDQDEIAVFPPIAGG
jgi:MoaD family protein